MSGVFSRSSRNNVRGMFKADRLFLTGILFDIAGATSIEVAEKIAREFGGTNVYFARNPSLTNKVSRLVGWENAQIISEKIGHGDFEVPTSNSRNRISKQAIALTFFNEGILPTPSIGVLLNKTDRTIRRWRSLYKNDLPKEGSLFEEAREAIDGQDSTITPRTVLMRSGQVLQMIREGRSEHEIASLAKTPISFVRFISKNYGEFIKSTKRYEASYHPLKRHT